MINPVQLEALLRRRYGEVKRQGGHNGLEFIVRCPVCTKRKLSINARSGMYQCWHGCMCGHVDNLFKDVELTRIAEAHARQRAAPVEVKVDMPGELIPLTDLPYEHQALSYLRSRNFDPIELDKVYGMRYCREGKTYAKGLFNTSNTIVIPIYVQGVVTGWQARLLYNPDSLSDEVCEALGFIQDEDGTYVKPPKYFTMPGFDKGKMCWNFDWARQGNLVVVTEGIFDAMAVGRSAIATFGKGVTEYQSNLLKAYWDLVVILLDPGDAEKEMVKLENSLSKCSVAALYVMLEGYKDAGEAPRMEIWRQIDKAISNNKVLAAAGKTLDTYRFYV